ncbi:MAG: CHAD domain-containing protein [Actinobacteria bacterium]|nr:CHAD domain-containing protein [Actinomycetota bacterium]
MMAEDHQEREWQFDAVDLRPVGRWLAECPDVTARGVKSITDTYLDTPDWRLHRGGYTLRLRETANGVEATMKSIATATDGLRERREITETLGAADMALLRRSPGPVGSRLRLLAGRASLITLFQVATTRDRFDLVGGDTCLAEVVLDETTIPVGVGAAPARLCRVEVEVNDGALAAVEPFVARLRSECQLVPAATSKFAAGLLVWGLSPPGPPDVGSLELGRDLTTGQYAFAVLRRQFRALIAREVGTRLGEDIEALHQMRVATRRLRSAMALFAPALPVRATRLRSELAWLADILGAVRDLDVQLEEVGRWDAELDAADQGALAPVVALLTRQRGAARRNLVRGLDSRRYARLVASFSDFLRRGPLVRSASANQPIAAAAPELVALHVRAVRKRAARITRASSPGEYHALRIRCKRLRYLVEFLSPLAPTAAPPAVRFVVVLQDLLGLHQDADVAAAAFRALADEDALPSRSVFVAGWLAARRSAQAERLRGRFPKARRAYRRADWRGVGRELGGSAGS